MHQYDGGGHTRRVIRLLAFAAVMAILLPPLSQPVDGRSELFKTSTGDTTADVRISVPPGYNDSASFTLPSAALVQGARFQMSGSPVTMTDELTESQPAFIAGTRLQDIIVDGGSLRLSDTAGRSQFFGWQGFTGCFTTSSDGCLTLDRDLSSVRFTPNIRPSPTNQSQYDPVVAVGTSGEVYMAWCDNRDFDYNIYFARSLDSGASFANARRINDDPGTSKARQEFPEIWAGPGKNVAIVWTDNRSGDERTYMSLSTDSGATFGKNIRVDDGPSGADQSHPSIAVMNSKRTAVAWEDNRGGAWNIRCAFSDDGQTFGPSVRVNSDNSGNEHYRPRIAAGAADFHIVWYDNRSGAPNSTDFNIYYARSSGNGFSSNVRVDDTSDKSFQALPSIAVGPLEKVHVVWHDTRLGPFRIFYSSSQDGISFGANAMVNKQDGPGKNQYQPRACMGADGVLHVVWHDYRSSEPDIFYANSTNGGLSFNGAVRVDDGVIEVQSRAPCVASGPLGDVHCVWWDNRTQGNLGSIYQAFYSRGIHPYFGKGSYETGPLDIGTEPSALVSACVTALQPPGTALRVFFRTAPAAGGNWTDWEQVGYCSTEALRPASRPGEMVRWRFELETTSYDYTPSVSSAALDYFYHPSSGTFLSRSILLKYPLRTASVNIASGKLGDGRTDITLELSADNGSRWAEAMPGIPVQFTGTGKVLLYRLEMVGSSSTTPTVSAISMDLRMESLPSDVAVTVGRSSSAAWTVEGIFPTGEPVPSPELEDQFNRMIQEARRTGRDTAIIRLNISSLAPGILKIGSIRILYDLPPMLFPLEPPRSSSVDEGGALGFTVDIWDPDNDALSMRWTLDGSLAQAGGNAFIYRPEYTESGLRNITVTASDGTLTAEYSWSVTVRDINRPPVIDSATPECMTTMLASDTARFEIRASDPDGDLLAYCWTVAGSIVQEGQDYFDYTAPAQPGTHEISVNISDGKDGTSYSWTVNVLRLPAGPEPPTSQFPWPVVVGAGLIVVSVAVAIRLTMDKHRRDRDM
jgi:hypothetical protein